MAGSKISGPNREGIEYRDLRDSMGSRLPSESLRRYRNQQKFVSALGNQTLFETRNTNTKRLPIFCDLQCLTNFGLVTRIGHSNDNVSGGYDSRSSKLLNWIHKRNRSKIQEKKFKRSFLSDVGRSSCTKQIE